jgi:hypothetical protein
VNINGDNPKGPDREKHSTEMLLDDDGSYRQTMHSLKEISILKGTLAYYYQLFQVPPPEDFSVPL